MARKPIESRLMKIENDMATIRKEIQTLNGNAEPIELDLSPCDVAKKDLKEGDKNE